MPRPTLQLPEIVSLLPARTDQFIRDWRRAAAAEDAPERAVTAGPMRTVTVGPVAIIQILDYIDQRWYACTAAIGAAIDQLVREGQVKVIILEIDSPGGSVYGTFELFEKIYGYRDRVKFYAIANSVMASAAYGIGVACQEVWVTPGGEVGAVGVWQLHVDYSKMLEELGLKYTLISEGKYKVEGNPYEPLGEEAKAFLQLRTKEYAGMFWGAVAKGRGVTAAQVRAGFGQGRLLGAVGAKAEGLVDRIGTLDELLERVGGRSNGGGRRALMEQRQAMVEREASLGGVAL